MYACLADIPYRFYVFSEELGNNEGHEPEKILFHYPSSRSVDDQLKDVGLAEAFFRFYNTFAPKGHFRVLRTSDGRMSLFSPEPSIWFCLTLRFPSVRPEGTSSGANSGALIQSNSAFTSDLILHRILSTFYQLWSLHNHTISGVLSKFGPIECRYRLRGFFERLLNETQPFCWNLLDVFSGISFLPLERISYLKVHSFVNRLECTFSQVSATMILYGNFLTWSGLNQDDTRSLYFYACHFLVPTSDSVDKAKTLTPGTFFQPVFTDGGPFHVVLRGHLASFPGEEPVNILAYKLLAATVIIVVAEEKDVNEEFIHDFSDFCSEHLLATASDLNRVVSVPSAPRDENSFKYIYYNTSNSALKSTIQDEKTRQIDRSLVSSETVTRITLLADYLSQVEPIDVATSVVTDTWVVVKKTAQRQLFLVVNRQRGTCTLIHVSDELRKLSNSTFSDILFLEI